MVEDWTDLFTYENVRRGPFRFRRRIPFGDKVGWFAVILIAIMLAPTWPWAAVTLVAAVAALRCGMKLRQRASERQRLIHDCETQHQEFLAGGQVIIPDGPLWSDDNAWSGPNG